MCVIWQQVCDSRAELIVLYFAHTHSYRANRYSMTYLQMLHTQTHSISLIHAAGVLISLQLFTAADTAPLAALAYIHAYTFSCCGILMRSRYEALGSCFRFTKQEMWLIMHCFFTPSTETVQEAAYPVLSHVELHSITPDHIDMHLNWLPSLQVACVKRKGARSSFSEEGCQCPFWFLRWSSLLPICHLWDRIILPESAPQQEKVLKHKQRSW